MMCPKRSGRFAVVVPQQSSQSFAAHDFPGFLPGLFPCRNQPVADPLVISLRMIMLKETGCGGLERSLPEEDHPPDAR